MWFLVATLIVMGNQYPYVERYPTQAKCLERKAYVEEVAKKYNAVIVVVCEMDT